MGLRRWVSGLLGNEESPADEDDDQPELAVDVPRRAGAIMEHYDLSGEDARQVAEILAAELGREAGYARGMIADRVAREVDLDDDLARRIVDTEVASIRNRSRVRSFDEAANGTARLRWIDSVGTDDSPVCADVRATIDERGPVPADELRDIIRETASDYESGTPDRADDLVPHEGCRHTVVRHVEE